MSFNHKVAVVTGASSGIGRATAFAFAQRGAKVVVADISVEGATETVELIRQEEGEATFIKTDVSQATQVEQLIQQTVATYGSLDVAFNNAGIEGETAPTAQCSEENWDRVIAANLKSVWLCMKYELQQMVAQGGGAIVNCASVAGLVGFPGVPAYCASKGGIIQLTRTAALEYSKANIRVNAVCPGVIETPMIDRFTGNDPAGHAQLVAAEPVGRLGEPEEIAEAVLWLCSEAASFVTGHPLTVDGGFVAQ